MQTYLSCTPNAPSSVRVCRDWLAAVCVAADHRELVDRARLCISELATNVLHHTAERHLRVEVTSTRAGIRVEVRDDAAHQRPRPSEPSPDDTGGRGLLLVDQLATRWGSFLHEEGQTGAQHLKTVWFELTPDFTPEPTEGAQAPDTAATPGPPARGRP
ncbi:ATP-binding protein [Streptomyces sp. NPDC001941]|uniref:ATP-binding protein n=1 Tax=Streptomyces sp. NPDC001941 TaxID=3154659 RepID=UPI003318540C